MVSQKSGSACPFCFLEMKNPKTHEECVWAFTPMSTVSTTFGILNIMGIDFYVPMKYNVVPSKQWLVN
jgi:hypothetical protein